MRLARTWSTRGSAEGAPMIPMPRQNAVDYGREWIDIAVKIGSPSVRHHLQVPDGQKPDLGFAAESLGQLAEYGSKRNIVVNLENDNATAEDSFLLVSVIEKVNNPYLRALPDFGNSLGEHDEDYNERGVKARLAHAWNLCHVTDSVKGEKGQRKTVDLARMFAWQSKAPIGVTTRWSSTRMRAIPLRDTKVGTGKFAVSSVRRSDVR
jgi:Xylose isomerase-like TIM barrel